MVRQAGEILAIDGTTKRQRAPISTLNRENAKAEALQRNYDALALRIDDRVMIYDLQTAIASCRLVIDASARRLDAAPDEPSLLEIHEELRLLCTTAAEAIKPLMVSRRLQADLERLGLAADEDALIRES